MATYHTVIGEYDKRPVQAWNKKSLVNTVTWRNGVPDNWQLTWTYQKSKSQLLEQDNRIYAVTKYEPEKIVDKFYESDFSIKILLLRGDCPELNPIELV